MTLSKTAGLLGVVQRREPVGEPADGVALAAAGGVFDEVVVAPALRSRAASTSWRTRLQLVVAREDHGLLLHLAALVGALLLDLQVKEAGEKIQQAVALENLLPQVGGAVGSALGIGGIAGAAVAAFVEGQEMRGRAREARGHEHRVGVHGEMDQRAALELEDGLARVAVLAVLALGIVNRLAGERVLEFRRGDGDVIIRELLAAVLGGVI